MAKVRLLRPDSTGLPATRRILREVRGPIGFVGTFSAIISILMLAYPLYMMNLFDRVLTSLSVPSLVALTFITVFLLVSLGFVEIVRSRLLNRLSVRFDEAVNKHVFEALFRANLVQPVGGGTLAQIEQIRAFLTGQGLVAFFDVPFVPIFLAVMFLMHPMLGILTLLGMMLVVLLGLSIEWKCKWPLRESTREARRAARFADNSMRNADIVAALGMVGNLRSRWLVDHQAAIDSHSRAADTMATLMGMTKAANLVIQVVILGVACYLVILQEATAGALFAANILVMRVITPLQQAMAAWRNFIGAREAFQALDELLKTLPEEKERLKLPKPQGRLEVEKVSAAAPKTTDLILKNISFKLAAGEALGVIGPSGSGKSTLARLLVGVWKPVMGAVRLDSAEVHAWEFDDLGPHLGYLPQDIELFDGTVADNICRFGKRDDAAILEAAMKIGLHDIILQLPEGYDTEIRGLRGALSGGQRQRLGLARALYGDPSLIVLDEPNSNLDGAGEMSLLQALANLKATGKTVVLVTHNPRILKSMDKVLRLKEGQMGDLGEPAKVLAKVQSLPQGKKAAGGGDPDHAPVAAS